MKLPSFLLALAVLSAGGRAEAAPAERPNILFIAIDDLNDWVGFLKGHPQARTPNLDRLARLGTVFANAHCAAPLCAPSRAAVFGGREPYRTGLYGNDDDVRRIAPDLVLLPAHLKAHGYRTYGAGKLLHQKRPDLFDEHFAPEQRWSPFTQKQVEYTPEELPSKGSADPRKVIDRGPGRPPTVLPLNRMPSDRRPDDPAGESFDWGPVDAPDSAMGDTQITDWAIAKLREPGAGPFFLGVGYYRPHIPLWAPAPYFEPFRPGTVKLPQVRANDLDDLGPVARGIARDPVTAGAHASVLKHGQWEAAVAAYLACVYFVDTQIGRLLEALEASPHGGNTAIVVWGDHGWHLGEKEHWGKWTGWERSTRVPLLAVAPGRTRERFAAGGVSAQPVSLVDLYPTILEFAGVPAPAAGLDGTSLLPLMRDPKRVTGRSVVTTFYGEHFSVRDARWRLIRYRDGSEELYDLERDPNEWTNLAGRPEHADTVRRLGAAVPRDPVRPAAAPKREKKAKKE